MSKKVSLCSFVKPKLLALIVVLFVFSIVSQAWAQVVDIEWIRQFGSSGGDLGQGLAVFGGESYVSGFTGGTLPGQISQGGFGDGYVRKYDASGNVVWTRQFGTSTYDDAPSIAVDTTGSSLYVVGTTDGTFAGQTNSGDFDIYLRKYDSNGNEVWTKQFGTSDYDEPTGVIADSSGIYISGYTYGIFTGETNYGDADYFIRKYDNLGNHIWTRQYGSTLFDYATGISIYSNNIYISGYTDGTFPGETSQGGGDLFVAKYDTNGARLWLKQFGTTAIFEESTGISSSTTGIYIGGYTGGAFTGQTNLGRGDAYVAKYDTDGNQQWVREFGTSSQDLAFGISDDSTGVYITGFTQGILSGQTSFGEGDVFLRKYDFDGNEVWTRQFGTPAFDRSWEVFASPTGIYLSGDTNGTFPGQSSSGGSDAFVAKLTQDSDSDGILDGVDTQPVLFSNDFSDVGLGGTTTGTITNRGDQTLKIAEDFNAGVIIKASSSGGVTPATVSVCGGAAVLSLNAGDSVTVTCGSVTVEVTNGTVDITFVAADGTLSTTSLTTDNSLTFEPTTLTFTAPFTNTGSVVVFINGVGVSLTPGETFHLVTIVTIDIKPGSDPNCFNNNDKGVIPVAILGGANFDATKVDDSTVKLEGLAVKAVGKKGNLLSHIEDVNADGLSDLVVQIQDQDNTFQEGTTTATLTGKLKAEFGGTPIEGTDSICIVP